MIVITGPGRSGTSVLAHLYKQLGFDPGGAWSAEVQAGFEDPDVVELNDAIVRRLRITMAEPPRRKPPEPVRRLGRRAPAEVRQALATAFDRVWPKRKGPTSPLWDRLPSLLGDYGEDLRRVARSKTVVKDPRFSWTLEVWALAGVPISKVVVTVRPLVAIVRSRMASGMSEGLSKNELRDALTYGFGACMLTLYTHDIPHVLLRFPEFLNDVDGLHERLPLPATVPLDEFREAFDTVYDPSYVSF